MRFGTSSRPIAEPAGVPSSRKHGNGARGSAVEVGVGDAMLAGVLAAFSLQAVDNAAATTKTQKSLLPNPLAIPPPTIILCSHQARAPAKPHTVTLRRGRRSAATGPLFRFVSRG